MKQNRRLPNRSRSVGTPGSLARHAPLAAALSAVLAGFPAAHADEQTATGVLENVIVTAQKRTEDLQSVPVSIQAISTVKLEEMHVENFNDYAKLLPSVAYQTLGPGQARVFMRGVASGDNGNHSGPLPSVGVYLDEQPVTTIQGALDIHVYDIARVEALAGPQGTLYGASSEAGTIRIITNKPDPTAFKAGYDLQGSMLEHGSGGYIAEGFVNLPINDSTAIRLVGWKEHDSGYIDNVAGTLTYPGFTLHDDASNTDTVIPTRCISNTSPPTPGCTATPNHPKKHYNDIDTYGARGALKVDLNDTWSITPTLMGQSQKSDGNFFFNQGLGDLKIAHYYPESYEDKWGQAALTVEGKFSNFDVVYAGSYMKRHDEIHQDYTDYSSYYNFYSNYVFDNAGTFINPSQYIIGRDKYSKQSHELRISSSADQPLRFVGGLFMQRQTHDIEQRYVIDGIANSLWVTGWKDTWWLTDQVRVDRDYAAFGELSYDLTSKLTATAGVRFFKAKNSLEGFYGFGLTNDFTGSTGEKSCIAGTGDFHGAPCKNLDKTVDETGHTPRVNLTYKFDPDKMIYVTYSEGFRPGGVNRRGTFPPYTSDFLKNYEIGWKTSWAGNRVRFNGAFFWEDWKDFQFSFLGANALTQVTNAGGARIRGVEADLQVAASDHLTLTGGVTLLEAKLTQDFCQRLTDDNGDPIDTNHPDPAACGSANFAPKDTQLPVTPKVKGNLSARYVFNVGDFDAHLQGVFGFQGSSTSALLPSNREILGPQKAYQTVDLAAGVGKGDYSFELFVTNAFDKRAELYRYAECDPTKCGVVNSYVGTIQPRLVGVKFAQKFGGN
jgi:iron complex outermembrane receptor protein